MRSSAQAAQAALLLLVSSASANPLDRRSASPDATDAWITVGPSGSASTITPSVTTYPDEFTSVVSPPPFEATETIFTYTSQALVRTSTASTAQPTATNELGAGSFVTCKNKDLSNGAPFCSPAEGQLMIPGTTYYVIWDPTFFNSTNTTLSLLGDVLNSTNGLPLGTAFSSDPLPASRAFYPWTIDPAILTANGNPSSINVSLTLIAQDANVTNPATNISTSPASQVYAGPLVSVGYMPNAPYEAHGPVTGPAVYIGLPTIFGFVILMLVGTCCWNKNVRHVGWLGVQRNTRGYGIRQSRRKRMGGKGAGREIQLDTMNGGYRDDVGAGARGHNRQKSDFEFDYDREMKRAGAKGRHARVESDLGSLAGSPTRDEFDFPTHGPGGQKKTGNAFRDEMDRQNRER